ncbi:Hypothetical protein I5071_64720 [Sandaracinus amylolyticus]|nr:Hypothetical protein I5071_64720 [Sandaracinus amylolyticus]
MTGGAGFVGSRLALALAAEGHRVVVADNLSGCGGWQLLGAGAVERVHADIRIADDLERLPGGAWDRVYHLAASFANARSVAYPQLDETTNVGGTANVIAHAKARGCGLFVYAGSSSSYGDVAPPFREDGPMEPGTPYARTKLAGEQLVRRSGLAHAVLRLFNVYGPGDVPDPWRNAIPNMIDALHRPDGRITLFGEGATRDFTYVDDVVRVLLDAPRAAGTTTNVATGVETSVRVVAETIARLVDASRERIVLGERRSWDRVVRRAADVTRLRETFGWVPSTPMEEGLRATVAWLRAEGLV